MDLAIHLPAYRNLLQIRPSAGGHELWDPVRKKHVQVTPEEIVRQLFISYLLEERKVVRSRLSVERQIMVYGKRRRYDLMIHDRSGAPLALVEVKAPQIVLDQAVLDQIARYNMAMDVDCLIVTNGRQTKCMHLDHTTNDWIYLPDIPDFKDD